MPSASTSSAAVNGMRMWSSGETDAANAALPVVAGVVIDHRFRDFDVIVRVCECVPSRSNR